jgi:hypothetical protein
MVGKENRKSEKDDKYGNAIVHSQQSIDWWSLLMTEFICLLTGTENKEPFNV